MLVEPAKKYIVLHIDWGDDMNDEEVYQKLINLFKDEYLAKQWKIKALDTPEQIKKHHGNEPLKQLRSLMILTGNHHLSDRSRKVKHNLWTPYRPAVGKRLKEEALKLPLL